MAFECVLTWEQSTPPSSAKPYQISTLEELLHEFNGCTIFTKLDLNKGYHQIALAPESRDLTAFSTHCGIFRYTHLTFGLSSAVELYQREIEHALEGIPGVKNISDDIIIGGWDHAELYCWCKYNAFVKNNWL